MRNQRTHLLKMLDWPTMILFVVLLFMGWFNIYAADFKPEYPSIFTFSQEYGKQFVWICIALIIAVIVLLLDTIFITTLTWVFYSIVLLLLVAVLIFGVEVNGAKAWFRIGSFGLQPAEFAKITTSLALAKYLSSSAVKFDEFKTRLISFLIIAIPSALILLQPDTGSVLVFAAFIFVLYREGLSGNILLFGLLAAVISSLTLIFGATNVQIPFINLFITGDKLLIGFMLFMGFLLHFIVNKITLPRFRKRNLFAVWSITVMCIVVALSVDFVFENVLASHQKIRINILFGLEEDPLGAGYNVKQAKTAIGSGGFSGKGYLEGTLTKFKYVPMQSTDFIFCTIGEEWGFLGSAFVVILFLVLLLRIVFLAERQRSSLSRIYGYSVACILFMHVAINIGMAIGLAPVIGIPLPFFSYGGSSIMAFTILIFIFLRLDASRLDVLN
ncbi:MAG: rod shape-determining protein RodA [Luteibaculaceae bacterium]